MSYSTGSLVWVHFPVRRVGLSEKLLKRYFGPYKILRRCGPVNYEVSTLPVSEESLRDIVHVSRLKPFHSRRPEDVASGGGYVI